MTVKWTRAGARHRLLPPELRAGTVLVYCTPTGISPTAAAQLRHAATTSSHSRLHHRLQLRSELRHLGITLRSLQFGAHKLLRRSQKHEGNEIRTDADWICMHLDGVRGPRKYSRAQNPQNRAALCSGAAKRWEGIPPHDQANPTFELQVTPSQRPKRITTSNLFLIQRGERFLSFASVSRQRRQFRLLDSSHGLSIRFLDRVARGSR